MHKCHNKNTRFSRLFTKALCKLNNSQIRYRKNEYQLPFCDDLCYNCFKFTQKRPGGGFEFVDKIFGGAVPRQYIPAVEKGMRESMEKGILAGYPVVDMRITLIDGSYHTVDSSEMAFKTASNIAFKKAMEMSKPVLLEPIYNLEVTCADSMMGDVIGDLNSKRGRILGMQSVEEGMSVVTAQVPYAEISEYAVDLRAITQGLGTFEMKFDHYEDVPAKMAEKIIADRKEA